MCVLHWTWRLWNKNVSSRNITTIQWPKLRPSMVKMLKLFSPQRWSFLMNWWPVKTAEFWDEHLKPSLKTQKMDILPLKSARHVRPTDILTECDVSWSRNFITTVLCTQENTPCTSFSVTDLSLRPSGPRDLHFWIALNVQNTWMSQEGVSSSAQNRPQLGQCKLALDKQPLNLKRTMQCTSEVTLRYRRVLLFVNNSFDEHL